MEMKIEIKHEEPTELGQGVAFGTTYAVRIHCREFTPLSGKTPNMGMAAFIWSIMSCRAVPLLVFPGC